MLVMVSTQQALLHEPSGDVARGLLIELPAQITPSKIARIPIRTFASRRWTGLGTGAARLVAMAA